MNNCSLCSKKAFYRDKKETLYCANCYWNLEENKEKKKDRSFDTYDGSDTYINCPHCGAGDLCDKRAGCIYQCLKCKIVDFSIGSGNNYCLECKDKVEEDREQNQQKREEAIGKKVDTILDEMASLQNKEPQDFTAADLQKIKELKQRLAILTKQKIEDTMLKGTIEDLQEALIKLEQEVTEAKNNPNKPKPPKDKQKQQLQQEIKELKAKISELENKPNKTPAEEAELTDKQEQLTKLTNNEQNDSNSWLKPTLIIGGGILLVGVIFLLINNNKKNKC